MYLLNCNNTISGALELFSLDYSTAAPSGSLITHMWQNEAREKPDSNFHLLCNCMPLIY
jgi:hypothetical protein